MGKFKTIHGKTKASKMQKLSRNGIATSYLLPLLESIKPDSKLFQMLKRDTVPMKLRSYKKGFAIGALLGIVL